MLSLVVNPGLPEEQQFTLAQGTVTIGRTKDNAVFCLHKSLSRKHAQLDVDGTKVKLTDLQSKNGIYFKGKRVSRCELLEGDSFRCGDITFLLEGPAAQKRQRGVNIPTPPAFRDQAAQTLPSPFALESIANRRLTSPLGANVAGGDDDRYKDKLFLLIRASELCVSSVPIDKLLEELIVLAVQVIDVDRIALFTLDASTREVRPRVVKTFLAPREQLYSARVVSWVVEHGSPASFADVSRDRTLPGDLAKDEGVRGAMCVPIDPGKNILGVIYADSVSRADCFRPDDLALLRALANLAAVAMERAALQGEGRRTSQSSR